MQWKTCDQQTQISFHLSIQNTLCLQIHSSSSELPDKADGSFSSKGRAIILKKTTLQCKTQSVRDRKKTHIKKIQSFNELSEAWLRLFRNVEHVWLSREEEILKNEIFKKKLQKQNNGGGKKTQKIKSIKNPEWRKDAQRSRITKGVFKETNETTFLKEKVEWYYESKRLVWDLLAIRWKRNSNNLSFHNIVMLEELNFQVQCLLGRSFQVVLSIKKSLGMSLILH